MRILILGLDGYLGWPLAQYLASRKHTIGGADSFLRRKCVEEVGGHSAIPIHSMKDRLAAAKKRFGQSFFFQEGDLCRYEFVEKCLKEFRPDAIVHLGQLPSAPYSMMDAEHAIFTQKNNIISNLNLLFAMKEHCPEAHLVKLGTMGEYGTPELDIPEGYFTVEYKGKSDFLPFPRQAGSWYHWSKVHDSNNIMFACKIWGLRSTDVMQGVVYSTRIDEMGDDDVFLTRFDFDQCFGTIINRFCAQAVTRHALTIYGTGYQRRGFLPLRDSVQCLTLAIENPPKAGECRVFNQFEDVYQLVDLAEKVKRVAEEFNLWVSVSSVENPRMEKERHYYNPDHKHLMDLGYKPTRNMAGELRLMFADLLRHKARIEAKQDLFIPDIQWSGVRRRSKVTKISRVKKISVGKKNKRVTSAN